MNFLITYGFHESGHYYVARALETEFLCNGEKAGIKYFYEPLGSVMNNLLFEFFLLFAKNGVPDVPEALIDDVLLDKISRIAVEKNTLHLEYYDVVVSTHPYTSRMIAEIKQQRGLDFFLVDCDVNYSGFPLVTHDSIDAYVGARPISGTPLNIEKKMNVTGIPINNKFRYDPSVKENIIVVMGGTHGMGNIDKVVDFLYNIESNYAIHVVTGNNKPLYNLLNLKYSNKPNIRIFGYCNNMPEILNKSKIVITKGSGSSIAESLASGNVLVFPEPVLHWEKMGAEYITTKRAGIILDGTESDEYALGELLNSSSVYEYHLKHALNLAIPSAAFNVLNVCRNNKMRINEDRRGGLVHLNADVNRLIAEFEEKHVPTGLDIDLYNYLKRSMDEYFSRMLK